MEFRGNGHDSLSPPTCDRLAQNQIILRRGVEELALDFQNNGVLELIVKEEDKQFKTSVRLK